MRQLCSFLHCIISWKTLRKIPRFIARAKSNWTSCIITSSSATSTLPGRPVLTSTRLHTNPKYQNCQVCLRVGLFRYLYCNSWWALIALICLWAKHSAPRSCSSKPIRLIPVQLLDIICWHVVDVEIVSWSVKRKACFEVVYVHAIQYTCCCISILYQSTRLRKHKEAHKETCRYNKGRSKQSAIVRDL